MVTGDSIAAFMRRISEASRVFVIFSEKYLHSVFCMTELYELWMDCRQRDEEFLRRIRVYFLPNAKIFTPRDRLAIALWWKAELAALEADAHALGIGAVAESTHRELRRMRGFVGHVDEILALIAGRLNPKNFEELVKTGLDDA